MLNRHENLDRFQQNKNLLLGDVSELLYIFLCQNVDLEMLKKERVCSTIKQRGKNILTPTGFPL